MKKIGLLFLAVVMVMGMAGCDDVLNKDEDPVGTWVINFDWNCNGTFDVTVWHVYTGGTFTASDGGSGAWKVNESDITLTYTNGTNYGGQIDGDGMHGTMTDAFGGAGCWTASRTSTRP